MRIALVTYALKVGGMESMLLTLARGLRDRGHEVEFVVVDSIGEWHDRPAQEGFPMRAIIQSWWESSRDHARRLAEHLSLFEAVLLNHNRTAQSAAGLLPEATAVLPILHNCHAEIFRIGLANIENVDKVVAVGNGVEEEVPRFGVSPEKVVCIRNGVEVPPVFPKVADVGQAGLRAVYVGRISHEQKGVFYLPHIIGHARRKGLTCTLDIVGDGPDLETLRWHLKNEHLDDVVTLHGQCQHEKAMSILSTVDVMLMPSHYEGQPIILFEAMARGIVPIVSLLPGITDSVITPDVDGILVAVGDEEGFVRALAALSVPEVRGEMSQAAWQRARDSFSFETMAKAYIELIERCREQRRMGTTLQRSGKLDLPLLGKRSQYPLFLHIASRMLNSKFAVIRNKQGKTQPSLDE